MQIYKQEQTFIKHRCKADITATILEAAAAAGGTTKAKIYYRSFFDLSKIKGIFIAFRRERVD
jgi:hypothetical protein